MFLLKTVFQKSRGVYLVDITLFNKNLARAHVPESAEVEIMRIDDPGTWTATSANDVSRWIARLQNFRPRFVLPFRMALLMV